MNQYSVTVDRFLSPDTTYRFATLDLAETWLRQIGRPDLIRKIKGGHAMYEYHCMYEYHWMYIPDGKTGVESVEALSRNIFLQELDDWNRNGGKTWKYWSK